MADDDVSGLDQGETEAFYAARRNPDKLYIETGTTMKRDTSSDVGQPMRYVHQALDIAHEASYDAAEETLVLSESPKRRYQVRALIVREKGRVREIILHRVKPRPDRPPTIEPLVTLKDEQADRLIAFCRALEHIEPTGSGRQVWSADVLGAILADPDTAPTLYSQDPAAFRTLITADAAAEDVIAVARRRDQLDQFELMMHDKAYFDTLAEQAGSKERVWQRFFERNPWIFGCSLTGQLLTSWDPDKLERVVSGGEVGSVEKRIDAFLRTKGAISSIVLAEIKHHRTDLLHAVSAPYRPGCWAVSPELAGAVAQVQGSVSLAVRALGHRLERTEPDGTIDPRDPTFLFQPRAFLVVGSLAEFTDGPGRFNQDKARSFELFRRNLQSPEILTFDELLERARWNVTGAARPR